MTGATIKKNLRTGRSLWADSPGLGVPVRSLTEAISVDVAIVGAGISGAFMAHELSRDHTVAVLDRRPPLTGSTIASTALLQWEIDLPLTALAEKIGPAKAKRAYLRSRSAVDALKRIVADERIVCGLKDKATLYLAGDEYGHRALEAEAAARAAIGLESEYAGPAALRERFGIDRTGAIVSQGSASADPARLAAGLLRRAQANGAKVWSRVEVMEAASDPDGVTLLTDAGHAVRAKSVVFCCGYEFPRGVPTPGARVISTWALASKPRQRCPAWLRDTLVWEASDPYLYFRMGGDGRLIVGGEDEADPDAHADQAKLKRKCETIVRKLRALLPGVEFEIDYSWAGAFGESATGLPSIAPVPDMDHAWAVMGFGGNGITYSVIASQVVSTALRGGADPDADLYAT
ncbi:MAG: FAD-binding oxidoreductase [Brevundimonas sp.]|uniref:NAD(P)/FAD-dependent oxidoreductase n=1 Tax=Brevundimonas sp. TaxID=1871086 RepID=UPI00271991CF|nr:FAD-binding oxidoreductase [Brevundimonas sp.]MDO9078921.1 FAD-binding oxidoreductase [Brevundimonas sp.]MDP3081129.1 FAD-binding oxidoreductase [Brevundimonas sp.]MDZ4060730.1 FAD-binding oxidoreductase [Brevundimonas sp.]